MARNNAQQVAIVILPIVATLFLGWLIYSGTTVTKSIDITTGRDRELHRVAWVVTKNEQRDSWMTAHLPPDGRPVWYQMGTTGHLGSTRNTAHGVWGSIASNVRAIGMILNNFDVPEATQSRVAHATQRYMQEHANSPRELDKALLAAADSIFKSLEEHGLPLTDDEINAAFENSP